MPEKQTVERAKRARREGKSPSTQAGEFVREEIHHVRRGKHGARSSKQAIAIGLSKARRAGVDLPPQKGASKTAKRKVKKSSTTAKKRSTSTTRSRAAKKALRREGRSATTKRALSRQAKSASKKRSAADRSRTAKKAARTKGPAKRSAAAKKAARTRRARAA